MSRDKIARKKLLQEPDEFLSLSQRVVLWAHANRTRAIAAVGGVVAVVLVALLAKGLVERSREKRAAEVADAVARLVQTGSGAAPANLRQEFAALAAKHAGTPQGRLARYFEAGALAANGDADAALKIHREIAADRGADPDLAALSGVALGYLELSRGASDAALTTFRDLLKSESAAVPRAQLRIEIAAIQEKLGRADEARKEYRGVAADYPEGPWGAKAKERLRALGDAGASAS
jgi:Flp pilus assembly protein TadD